LLFLLFLFFFFAIRTLLSDRSTPLSAISFQLRVNTTLPHGSTAR